MNARVLSSMAEECKFLWLHKLLLEWQVANLTWKPDTHPTKSTLKIAEAKALMVIEFTTDAN